MYDTGVNEICSADRRCELIPDADGNPNEHPTIPLEADVFEPREAPNERTVVYYTSPR